MALGASAALLINDSSMNGLFRTGRDRSAGGLDHPGGAVPPMRLDFPQQHGVFWERIMAASSFARLSLARSPLAFLLGSCIAVLAGLGANRQAAAQPALPALPSWADAAAIEAAKKEATLVVYSSVNEEEALRIWRRFEELTGVKVEYVRGSDTQLIARMAIESRAGRGAWDVALMTAAHKLPQQMLAQIDPSVGQAPFSGCARRQPQMVWIFGEL